MAVASLSELDWPSPWLASLAALGSPVARAWADGLSVADALNEALAQQAPQTGPDALPSSSGLPHCVPQASLPEGEAYEAFIRRTGQLPTRDNRHDFFNGLLWLHQPAWKLRLNRFQAEAIASHGALKTTRGPLRDALTLFDENGAVLHGPAPLLAALRERHWQDLFLTHRALWREARFTLVGHALLDSLSSAPRKGLTAHVLLADPLSLSAYDWAQKPFCPLPVMGLPGWWPGGEQDAAFYADVGVFRPLARSLPPTGSARPCRS